MPRAKLAVSISSVDPNTRCDICQAGPFKNARGVARHKILMHAGKKNGKKEIRAEVTLRDAIAALEVKRDAISEVLTTLRSMLK